MQLALFKHTFDTDNVAFIYNDRTRALGHQISACVVIQLEAGKIRESVFSLPADVAQIAAEAGFSYSAAAGEMAINPALAQQAVVQAHLMQMDPSVYRPGPTAATRPSNKQDLSKLYIPGCNSQ